VAQEPRQERRRGGTVHVVIAEDRDFIAGLDRIGNPPRRRRHVGDDVRIRHQPLDARIEKGFDRIDADAAASENAREQLGQPVMLDDRARAEPRSSSRSRQARPVADRATPKNARVGAFGEVAKTIVIEARRIATRSSAAWRSYTMFRPN